MDEKAKIGVAVATGYLLGRSRKGKVAVSLALWLGGSQLGLEPKKLAREGLVKLANSPQVSQVGQQLRGPIADAGRKAAVAVLETRVNRLADSLHELNARGENDDNAENADNPEDATDDDRDDTEQPAKKTANNGNGKKASSSKSTSRRSTRQTSGRRTPAKARS